VPGIFVDECRLPLISFVVLTPVSGNGALASSLPRRVSVGRSSLPRSARVSAAAIVRRQASATCSGMLSIIDFDPDAGLKDRIRGEKCRPVFGNPLRKILSDCLVLRLDSGGRNGVKVVVSLS
jgi:hypothetical protein